MSAINALIRLMAQEKGAETPVDRYARIKAHPAQWDKEMDGYGLSPQEKEIIKEYCGHTYGTLPLQDDLMLMMMDDRLFGFDLETTNNARKIIGKKLMNKIPELHEQILKKAKSEALGKYVWEMLFSEQLGYAFNAEHTYSYSLIGVQCAYLATHYPSVYWNTACLRVDSGLEEEASTNYNKIAKAIGAIQKQGIKLSLIDINKSQYMFEPNEETDTIIYGMKGLNGVGGEVIQEIVSHRPYDGLNDFMNKVKVNKTVMVSLIKSGAFDQFGERKDIMKEYLWQVCEPKKRITLQNFKMLMDKNLLPQELDFQKRLFIFNKALKTYCKRDDYFVLDRPNFYHFYEENFDVDLLEPHNNNIAIAEKQWKKIYSNGMLPAKEYFKENQQQLLDKLNDNIFQESWNKYAKGNYSSWEMDSLGMYYHPHELKNIDFDRYDIVDFSSLGTSPIVANRFVKKGVNILLYKTFRIAGTAIAKDDVRSMVSILTVNDGVVDVKMPREQYAEFNRRISEIQPDGTKKIREQGWFTKGTLLVFNGIRRNDTFFLKKYKKTKYHRIYKITNVNADGSLNMTWQRYGSTEE